MSKPEFGRKVTCVACAVRFYDLSRTPAVCPKCGQEQPRVKPRMAPPARTGAPPPQPFLDPPPPEADLPDDTDATEDEDREESDETDEDTLGLPDEE
jgi:hypothetical protein